MQQKVHQVPKVRRQNKKNVERMDRNYTYKILRCAYNVFDELGLRL